MKKKNGILVLLVTAVVFSIAMFAPKNEAKALRVLHLTEDDAWCDGSGGNCLDTVVIIPQDEIAPV